jgi:periplasmic protein TonB
MIGRRLAILSASAALHLGGVGLMLLVVGVGAGSVVPIDLVSDTTGDGRPAPRADTASPRRVPAGADESPRAHPPRPARVSGGARGPAAPAPGDQRPPGEAPTPGDPSPSAAPASPLVAVSPLTRAAVRLEPEDAEPGQDGAPTAGRGTSPSDDVGASAAGGGRPGASGPAAPAPGSGGVTGAGDTGSPVALAATGEGRGGLPPEYAPYLQRFRRRVAESMRYPLAARRQGLAGTVELEVLLEPSGRVAEARVIASSSHAVLDEAALDAVKRLTAEPFPERLPRRPLRIHLPLTFELE